MPTWMMVMILATKLNAVAGSMSASLNRVQCDYEKPKVGEKSREAREAEGNSTEGGVQGKPDHR